MQDGAALLHTLVMAAAHDFAVENQYGANRYAARFEADTRLRDGGLEKRVHSIPS